MHFFNPATIMKLVEVVKTDLQMRNNQYHHRAGKTDE
jgi:hypothetical protein